ncbi:MAG: hypothetical protein ACRD9R_09195 [Pyrinomonadaceae bacterium]
MKITRPTFRMIVSLIFVALSASSCIVVSVHPLVDPASARKPDQELRGRWAGRDAELQGIYAQFDGNASMETNILSGKGNEAKPKLAFEVANAKIGKHQYMSLKPRDESVGKGYLIVRYAIAGDELKVWLLDAAEVSAAISEGQLKSGDGGVASTTNITDSPAKIAAFIEAREDTELFEYLGTFKKVKE